MRDVAIVGRSCILPGALDPQSLWNLSVDAKVLFEHCRKEHWRADLDLVCEKQGLKAANMLGSYVYGFDQLYDPEVFNIPEKFSGAASDPLFKWVLYSAWESLKEAGGDREEDKKNCALILGHLSFPSSSFSSFCERFWLSRNGLGEEQLKRLGLGTANRTQFLSGLPALLTKASLGLGGQAYSLDATCASSLFALKNACDLIQNKQAKLVLVGGVHHSDDLFLHMGLSRLDALSKQGQCKPFQADTDGLVPAEGAGFVCLMDLQEAEKRGSHIYGLIKGVGSSNDGDGHGFLVPRTEAQIRAIEMALNSGQCLPEQVSYVECHGTGTLIGDATEIQSLKQVYLPRKNPLFLGTLKGNIGHLVPAAGIAGLIRVTEAIKNAQIPPLPYTENPIIQFEGSPFELPGEPIKWESDKARIAGLSAFGFGGNNAHIIVEEYQKSRTSHSSNLKCKLSGTPYRGEMLAVVAVKMKIGSYHCTEELSEALFSKEEKPRHLDLKRCKLLADKLKFSPGEMESSLGQHLLALELFMEARSEIAKLNHHKTGVVVGMGLDPNVCRYGFHMRLDDWATSLVQNEDWLQIAKSRVASPLSTEGTLGSMPSMMANRFSKQEDFGGPSYAVSAEEHSGGVALNIAIEQLKNGSWDAAFVAAVDLASEQIHGEAIADLANNPCFPASDGGAVLVLKRFTDAIADGDHVHAVIGMELGEHSDQVDYALDPSMGFSMSQKFGQSHAASALIHVAGAVLSLHYKLKPGGDAWILPHSKHLRACKVSVGNILGDTWTCTLSEDPATSSIEAPALPKTCSEESHREQFEIPYHWPTIHLPPLSDSLSELSLDSNSQEEEVIETGANVEPKKTIDKSAATTKSDISIDEAYHSKIVLQVHKAFLSQQRKTHEYFLEYRQKSLETLYSLLPKKTLLADHDDAEVVTKPISSPQKSANLDLDEINQTEKSELCKSHHKIENQKQEGAQSQKISEKDQFNELEWSAKTHSPNPDSRLEYPRFSCAQSQFTKEQVLAFFQGNIFECFGKGFERLLSHRQSPRISDKHRPMIDEILVCECRGGPWQRGYMKSQAVIDFSEFISLEDSHKDAGRNLVIETCKQNLAFFMTFLGFTLERDAWKFKQASAGGFSILSLGKQDYSSKLVEYEVFIEELIANPSPQVTAYILIYLDGIKTFLAEKIALEMVPDFDLAYPAKVPEHNRDNKEFPFDENTLMACALGSPDSAFPIYQDVPQYRRIPRLPAPPYHFCTAVHSFRGEWGKVQEGAEVEMEYHFQESDWYFGSEKKMPFCVLMEIALQPCIWLSSALGSANIADEELFSRNLNVKAILDNELEAATGQVNTKARLIKVSKIASMFVQSFEVSCFLGSEKKPFFRLQTDFGLLSKLALENQVSFLSDSQENDCLKVASNMHVSLNESPPAYMQGKLSLPSGSLLMLDRVTYCDFNGGSKGLGFLVAEKDVRADEWFFKSHFFNDPVMPESLGFEAALQLLRFFCIEKGLAKTAQKPEWEVISLGRECEWKFRGQVEPESKLITYTLNIDELVLRPDQVLVSASSCLWVDGKKISVMPVISLRIKADGPLVEENFEPELPLSRYFDSECRLSAEIIEQINANPYSAKKIFGSCEPQEILFKEYVAHKEGVSPIKVPSSFPFNEYPAAFTQEEGELVLFPGADTKLQIGPCIDFWSQSWGVGSWLGEDLLSGLLQRFVHSFYIDEPKSLIELKNKPLIFMTNQQVGVENLIFAKLMGAYLGKPIVNVFRQEHQALWMRDLLRFYHSYPSINIPEQELTISVPKKGGSDDLYEPILEGIIGLQTLSLPALQVGDNPNPGPMTKAAKALISSIGTEVFYIVPVGFFGSLPDRALDKRLSFPYAMSKQKIMVGKPMSSEDLLNYSTDQRMQVLTDAIKSLDKMGKQEELLAVDEQFGRLVHSWMLSSRVKVEQAVLFCTLREMIEKGMKVSSQTQRIVEARLNGVLQPLDDPDINAWLERVTRWLLGRKYLS